MSKLPHCDECDTFHEFAGSPCPYTFVPTSEKTPYIIRRTETYWERERRIIIETFSRMLRAATGDGSKKRQSGEKPPWYKDDSHEAAIFSHITKWKKGETIDSDSGAHPLVHAGWRCLAIAYQEAYGKVDPEERE